MADCYIIQNRHAKGIPVVSWQNGSDTDIAAMITADDAGQINLTDYWSVGDSRTVGLSAMSAGNAFTTAMAAQNVVLVLMDTGLQSGYVDVNNNTVNFVVGQKDCLSQLGRVNTTQTNRGSWNNCAIRTDLNNKYYNALPATFRACLKQFKTVTATEYDASTLTTTNDYIALFAEKEVDGAVHYGNATEATALVQIDYYKTDANKIKKLNSDNNNWYERSPGMYNMWGIINPYGAASGANPASVQGVAPFMCI